MQESLCFYINRWSAWMPQVTDLDAWKEWAQNPRPIESNEIPSAKAVPALLRRRLKLGGRAALQSAFACLEEDASSVSTVFSSRHGEAETTNQLLTALARNDELSPNDFSLSVHNSVSGLFSIFAKNKQPSVSLAARHQTFSAALLESGLSLFSNTSRDLLLVHSDELLPEIFTIDPNDTYPLHSLALYFSSTPNRPDACRISLSFDSNEKPLGSKMTYPQPLEFIRWLLGEKVEINLKLGGGNLTAIRQTPLPIADELWRECNG